MTIYRAIFQKQEMVAYTDSKGWWRIASPSFKSINKRFTNFEEVKKNFKSFAKIEELALIDYDLSFRDFVNQFEDGTKETNCLDEEIKIWQRLKTIHDSIREIEKRIFNRILTTNS